MAHNLATTNGKTAMMYTGETPWHKLGTRLTEPPTAQEAMIASGLDYAVELRNLQTIHGTTVLQRKATIRADTGQVLGVVGNNYQPIQNSQAFSFLDALVAKGQVRYHTAGALGHGERIWLLAKLPKDIRVNQTDDLINKFLLLSNTHDGTTALRVLFTPIRVVCQNTLNLAERQGTGQGIAIQHKGDLATKIREAQRVLGLTHRFYEVAEAKINHLASHQPTVQQVYTYFEQVYPDPSDADNARVKRVRDNLVSLFESGVGQGMSGIRGTTWAAYNAVTEWVDHHRPTRSSHPDERASRRLNSAWFGEGARIKGRAWDLALEMALAL
jgi:phage/plasmid-like protein (TIGR03299 family)